MSSLAVADDLTACVARVKRSHQLIVSLEEAIVTYLSTPGRIEISQRFDRGKAECVFAARLVEPLPVEWSLILSDAIHQARAACDNAVHALIVHRGQVPSKRACFPPIFGTEAEYVGWKSPRKGPGPLSGLLQSDLDHIEMFQPWHPRATATSKYLRLLQELSNEDKHRLAHVISVFVTSWGNRTTGETVLAGMPLFPRANGKPGVDSITDFPPNRLFPVERDVESIGEPDYHNEPLTLDLTDIVRLPIVPSGPDPRLGFFMPRLRVLYTARGINELSIAPTIRRAFQAAAQVVDVITPLLSPSSGVR